MNGLIKKLKTIALLALLIMLFGCVSESQHQSILLKNQQLNNQLALLSSEKNKLEEELSLFKDTNALARELDTNRQELTRLKSNIEQKENTINVAYNEVAQLKHQNESIEKRIEILNSKIRQLAEENEALKNRIAALATSGFVVIAPSVSTSIEARSILARQGWSETSLRNASAALVVVRSMLFNPLFYSYDSFFDLKEDAENQLNISGENFHVYIYSLDDDLRPIQVRHVSYKADEY